MGAPLYGEVAETLRRSTVQVKVRGRRQEAGSGSGVIWSPDGLIVTNAHVIQGPRVSVELWDGSSLPATVTSRDPRRDLATLRVEAAGLPAAIAGDSGALRPGELVMAIGNPLGFIGALTTGVVHALGPLPQAGRQSWVQAAVRLAPGNSGGPLADAAGRVIGINTMIVNTRQGGLALAVPSNTVRRFLREGPSTRLGVTLRPVEVPQGPALLVLEVEPGSAAERASLLIGDVLLGANGRRFRSYEDLADVLDAGGLLRLEFLRGDRRSAREVTVQLAGGQRAEAA